ncbi:MAG TPA: hypothetical protein VEG34_02450 [Thermoanaerobaculia bacterium]|nr:hypothetical protein [Thermoanaerobaculia bacterium]
MKRVLWPFGIALLLSTVLAVPMAAQEGPAGPSSQVTAPESFEIPSPVPMLPPPVCTAVQNTPIRTGFGSTCTVAQNNLIAQLLNDAACGECDFCTQIFIIKQCYATPGGGFDISGYLRYSCELCPQ